MAEPKIIEVSASASLGGKVSIVDYGGLSSDFHLSQSERWNVEGLSEEEAESFRQQRLVALIEQLEPFAQGEFDQRLEQRRQHNPED